MKSLSLSLQLQDEPQMGEGLQWQCLTYFTGWFLFFLLSKCKNVSISDENESFLANCLRYYCHAFDMDESKIDLHDSYICFANNWVLLLCLIFNNMHHSVVFERILNYSFYACKVNIHLVDKIGWEKRRIYGLNSSNLCLWISRRLCHLTLYE